MKSRFGSHTDFTSGLLVFFGFRIHDRFSLFIDIGLTDIEGIPIGITILWKFFESKNKVISKLFLSDSKSFNFINIYKFNRIDYRLEPLEGTSYVSSNDEKIYIKEAVPYDIKHFCFTLNTSIKYTLTYKWFNLHANLGLGIQIFNASRKYNLKLNVDYVGSGSPTGVDTTAIVDFKEKWVHFLPYFQFAISFNITRWLRFPVFGVNLSYDSAEKTIHLGIVANVLITF